MSAEKRTSARRRTRLRGGKIVDTTGKFVVECLIYDRSGQGARIALVAPVAVPPLFRLFDEESNAMLTAEIVWQRRNMLGVRIVANIPADALEIANYARAFYAVGGTKS